MNFCDENICKKDRDSIFNNEEYQLINWNMTLADILVKAGIFSSRNIARKNGWDRPIPEGFNQIKVGKRYLYVHILPIKVRPLALRYKRRFDK